VQYAAHQIEILIVDADTLPRVVRLNNEGIPKGNVITRKSRQQPLS
jgi:hypothetical protein